MATVFEVVLPFGIPRANEIAETALDELKVTFAALSSSYAVVG